MDARYPRWWGWGIGLLGLVLVTTGVVWWGVQSGTAGGSSVATPPSEDGRSSTVVAGRRLPEAKPANPRPGDPLRLQIPTLGWWADGARPGEARGSALVTGHTVSTGGGALDDLEELGEGDAIRVSSARTRTVYSVESVRVLAKGDLAVRAEQLFDQDVAGRLVVVTCEDWDGEEYLSNVVVTATPTRAG